MPKYSAITCRRKCPYAACIDVCEDYDKKMPPGLRSRNPKEYWRRYKQIEANKKRQRVHALNSYYRRKEKAA